MAFSKSTVRVVSFAQETRGYGDYSSLLPERMILSIISAATVVLLSLPYEERDGGLVPTIIFHDCPQVFYAMILSLLFACFTSAAAILNHEAYPRCAELCRQIEAASMVVAAAALTWAIAWTSLRWGAALCVLWVVMARVWPAMPWNRRISERSEEWVYASLHHIV